MNFSTIHMMSRRSCVLWVCITKDKLLLSQDQSTNILYKSINIFCIHSGLLHCMWVHVHTYILWYILVHFGACTHTHTFWCIFCSFWFFHWIYWVCCMYAHNETWAKSEVIHDLTIFSIFHSLEEVTLCLQQGHSHSSQFSD